MKNNEQYIGRDRKKRKAIVLVFFALWLITVVSVFLIGSIKEPLSTEKADALYGGQTNLWGYPFAGYITDYSSVFTRQVCGITYLSETTGISAAHCFEEDGIFYSGTYEYSTPPEENYPIRGFFFHPDWERRSLRGDIAYVTLDNPVEGVDIYAEIATPLVGCGYEVLAYGARDQESLSNYDLRRSASVCIEAVTDDRFYLRSPDGGVCFGDSGSPVFVKDTNKIVGIISAITVDESLYSEENCFVNNKAVATRADTALQMISDDYDEGDRSCPKGSENICKDKEVCRSNRCMKIDDFVYISALDYRSGNFALSGFTSTASKILLALSTLFFILVMIVRVNGTRRLSS